MMSKTATSLTLSSSAPPAIITSCRPCWIASSAKPMAWLPAMQAVEVETSRPRSFEELREVGAAGVPRELVIVRSRDSLRAVCVRGARRSSDSPPACSRRRIRRPRPSDHRRARRAEQARRVEGQLARARGEERHAPHGARLLPRPRGRRLEVADGAADPRAEAFDGLPFRDDVDPRSPFEERATGAGPVEAQRTQACRARHDHPSALGHGPSSLGLREYMSAHRWRSAFRTLRDQHHGELRPGDHGRVGVAAREDLAPVRQGTRVRGGPAGARRAPATKRPRGMRPARSGRRAQRPGDPHPAPGPPRGRGSLRARRCTEPCTRCRATPEPTRPRARESRHRRTSTTQVVPCSSWRSMRSSSRARPRWGRSSWSGQIGQGWAPVMLPDARSRRS